MQNQQNIVNAAQAKAPEAEMVKHIIIQAGGMGKRLEHLTANKPKALVPVDNLPMLFHLFRKFHDCRFIIIADYLQDVLSEYLQCFADVCYQLVRAEGEGTCGGLKQAVELLPEDEPFMLVWSDLILSEGFMLPVAKGNYIGVSETFSCRWSYKDGRFDKEASKANGVAGLFIFENKHILANVPKSGEFVRWLSDKKCAFDRIGLAGTREFGLLSEYETLPQSKTRPFNKISHQDERIVKEALDAQGINLAKRECKWYEQAHDYGIKSIPIIYEYKPLVMERINGKNVYECEELPHNEKLTILQNIANTIHSLHNAKRMQADSFSVMDAYFYKTFNRLNSVRNLIRHAEKKSIVVNNRECRNAFMYKNDLERLIRKIMPSHFSFIHGDCTFSNIMLRENGEAVLIDPRGYFGHTELYGDTNYDWAKLYYSIVGNYDQFNLKNFRLSIHEEYVGLDIQSNGWECMELEFFDASGADKQIIKLIHAIIWLSLTTYAWQDYDSICGAFYNGLYHLEECFNA